MDFLENAVRELKKLFTYISIEIYPMLEADYRRLFNAGVHGLTIYQETYNRELYAKLHPAGPKSDYSRRLEAVAEGARAGFYNLGLGALLGLYDWRLEAVSMAAHGLWLKKHFWKSRLQFSFPRITPIEGGFEVPAPGRRGGTRTVDAGVPDIFPGGRFVYFHPGVGGIQASRRA